METKETNLQLTIKRLRVAVNKMMKSTVVLTEITDGMKAEREARESIPDCICLWVGIMILPGKKSFNDNYKCERAIK